MDKKVIFAAFSGEKVVSKRETDMYGYYDGDNPEIDDVEYIKANRITAVEIHIFDNGNHVLHKNYYDENGAPYRFETTENGVTAVEDV